MASLSKGEVYHNFLAFYQKDSGSGNLSPCTGAEQVRQGKELLDSAASSCQRFQRLDFYRLARDFVAPRSRQQPRQQLFRALGKAFELLELISVNLYLWPWRKEIKTIKTFTGAFVYFIQPVLPPDVLQGILEKMGYTRKGASEYVMSKQVSKEEIGQLGFEFFLARAECELMQEALDQAVYGGCQDIVQIRSTLPLKQADCVKYLNTIATGSGILGEGVALGNEGSAKSGLHSELPNAPSPLTATRREGALGLRVEAPEDGKSDATHDPLSASVRLPPDSIDLYSEYTDIAIATDLTQKLVEVASPAGKLEQYNSLLVLDESLMQNAQAESLVKLSPGQTGPLSLSPFSNSTLIATSSDNKNLKNKDRAAFDTLDQNCPDDKWSGKSYQMSDSISSLKYGGFMNGNANDQKKDYISAVEIELKNIDTEKLPYPIAETAGPVLFHQTDHFRASESQCVGLSHPERTAAKPLRQTQPAHRLSARQNPAVAECCMCSPTELLGGMPLLDTSDLAANSTQESGGKIVREPPQSFYIPPDSLEGKASAAIPCDVCGAPICPNCSSELTAGQCQTVSRECLQIQELMVRESLVPFLYVSKLTGESAEPGDEKPVRCNRCKEGP